MGEGGSGDQVRPDYELKRYHPRQTTDWTGEYALSDDPDVWRSCRIVDISSSGAGVELEGAPTAAEGTEIVVRVRLRGVVRHVRDDEYEGPTRAGLEFSDPVDQLRAYLASFTGLEHHG